MICLCAGNYCAGGPDCPAVGFWSTFVFMIAVIAVIIFFARAGPHAQDIPHLQTTFHGGKTYRHVKPYTGPVENGFFIGPVHVTEEDNLKFTDYDSLLDGIVPVRAAGSYRDLPSMRAGELTSVCKVYENPKCEKWSDK